MPELWSHAAYPSRKPLAAWVADYSARVAALRSWATQGLPAATWLPGLFFPQGFLTAVLQAHARKYAVPIDTLSFSFEVRAKALPCLAVTGVPGMLWCGLARGTWGGLVGGFGCVGPVGRRCNTAAGTSGTSHVRARPRCCRGLGCCGSLLGVLDSCRCIEPRIPPAAGMAEHITHLMAWCNCNLLCVCVWAWCI